MSASIAALHPLLAHHIVNSLGWRDLRPLQEAAVAPILAGKNAVLLAPTAGGKTEAAVFPVLSRILTEPKRGPRVLYICPLKALLNNLHTRLAHLAGLVGLRAEVRHGDTPAGARRRMAVHPPDILLTTPESLEVLLVGRAVDKAVFFANLTCCIIDEVHAFAGDDRGRHLPALLHRIEAYTSAPLQRLGLSATVGNPDTLLAWLADGREAPGVVLAPPAPPRAQAEVRLDYVGTDANAALLISRLHRGEKRLVFCDSRARVEALTAALRGLGVRTYICHGSLAAEERLAAEEAFAQGDNCVIVATSTLELGIDVGDLDRVIQIDAPTSVASFLQRLGRTGRRAGTRPNCLFLTTDDAALMQAAGLLLLWREGYVEPIRPPTYPAHLLAQQMMALCLEYGGMRRAHLLECVARPFADIPQEDRAALLDHLLARRILSGDGRQVWMGDGGEALFGRKHFMELFAVFTAPPMFQVLHGRRAVGQVHEHSFSAAEVADNVLLLGGRCWRLLSLDWGRRIARVEPSERPGTGRWPGVGASRAPALCRAVDRVLHETPLPEALLTRRAAERLAAIREDMAARRPGSLVRDETGRITWWTFAGTAYNAAAAHALEAHALAARPEALSVVFKDTHANLEAVQAAVAEVAARDAEALPPKLDPKQIEGLKFHQCLPAETIARVLYARTDLREAAALMQAGPLGRLAPHTAN